MIIRMKEIRAVADNPSYSKKEKQQIFEEYKGL
jgi:hypothetical protein